MGAYLLQRLLLFVPVFLGISVVVFGLSHMIPGDPVVVMLGQEATTAEIARLRGILGLDQPLPVQYARWLGRLVQGDMGRTLFGGQAVFDLLKLALPATLELTVTALRRGSAFDYGSMGLALLGVSMPVFWMGILLILTFSLRLGWLPFNGRG